MNPTATTRLLVVSGIVVALVGVIDAAIGGEWDLFVLFMTTFAIATALGLRFESRRPAIPIRRDLVAWLRDRSSISGEPLSTVADRAISTYADRYGVVAEADEARQ
ncbi:MAG: hypothetical protein QGM46_06995 [Actinomycetota bacterium]|nr:hypothetical protein [Actinomycetota bacterium]MDK1016369.1 hypothetical protein [Actinomycetota bacterium]MDK1026141.1 hypothetical protein [Actinomycetota bacterium]MDK1037735.1 hypothetical protein [Actinomycetota bacterium]MDK1095982.1 hypothetical protein [Actinomycetota bacterium]